jgi:integrase/recombinase XerC/integrase/recombinase XerD
MKKKLKAKNLPELVELFKLKNQVEGKSDKTTSWYDDNLRSFLSYLKKENLGIDLPIFRIDVARKYILYLQNRTKFAGNHQIETNSRLAPETVQGHARTLKAFASWLHRDGYTLENRLSNIKIPNAPRKMVEPLTPEEIKRNFKVIDRKTPMGKRNYAFITVMLDTGLRVSEETALNLSEVNLEKSYLKVMGKGSKERLVPIGDYSRAVLLDYVENARPQPVNQNINNLFLTSDGKPLSTNAIKLLFSRLKKASGVKRLHPHLCRHTFATNYLLNGGDVFTLKAILGHSSLEMVNHYLHFSSSMLAALHHQFSPMDRLQGK